MATPIATSNHDALDTRPSYLAATIAATVVFALYVLTLGPSTAMWDTSEYIAAAYTMGIPHPPGNPFFVLIGRVFSLIPMAPSVAMRINVLAAVSSAVSAGMWFLITERVLVGWLPNRWQRIVGGSLAAIIGASAFTVWSQSVVNEKVYTVSLVFFAIVAWLTVRWADDPDGPRADRWLVLIAYLLGLGYSNHPAGFLVGPAVGIAVLLRRPQTLLRWRLILACVGALVLGITPFATQPIRAAYNPAINEGEPTACRAGLAFDCTFSEGTYEAFKYNFNREQYGKPPLAERQAPFTAQVGMWWLYFKWQWLRDAHQEHPVAQQVLAVVFLLLGIFGGYVHWTRDRRSFYFFGPLMFTITLLLIFYMNFKYGASQAPELGDAVAREVRDRDYFYLWSFSAWSVWAALGLVFVWESMAALFRSERVRVGLQTLELPTRRSWLLASPVLLIACVPILGNWTAASKAGDTTTRDFAHDLLQSVEPYGILVTVGDNDTFPLWYAQEVEGIRRDVVVANTSLLNTDWYVRQLIRRENYPYDAEKGPAIYRDSSWIQPVGAVVSWTLDEADALPLYQQLNQPAQFQVPGTQINTTVPPGILERADLFVLKMIQDNPHRSVYFSNTAVGYPGKLGLQQYLLTQGLARKLLPVTPTASRDTIPVPGRGMLDLQRTEALWFDVFEAPESLVAKGDWIDKPSVGIPYLYVDAGLTLAQALQLRGQDERAAEAFNMAIGVAKATRLSDDFGLPETLPPAPTLPPAGDTAIPSPVPPGENP
ncbi:MAG: glycosyltransferase family 117 protein [Gemmatimonadaceae bacterium]